MNPKNPHEYVPWTSKEDATVRDHYLTASIEAVARMLPGRSVRAIRNRAGKLGVRHVAHWTEAEDRQLTLLWGDGVYTLADLAAKFHRSERSVYDHATKRLGLPSGCPQGYEYLNQAAKRVGFAQYTLRRILKWARVMLYQARTCPTGGRRWCRIVDTGELDEAIDAWLQSEPCETAAARVGVCGQTLRRRLALIGVTGKRKARHLRVTPNQVKAAMSLPIVNRRVTTMGVNA